ncbi:transcriptional regulator [Lactobacillus sp. UCMA15818]|uniref:transcriptional regulator n=1 Tax=Lactobacillus sp. UCMA15818 TaxID=2583394 RepID=UPI0025B10CC6|nr:transcriptional regulator [Lactobacillus sp. UCMA15818]MDN2452556.1 transcriptional regulator [Lactobacillus sp. UCMA15818]
MNLATTLDKVLKAKLITTSDFAESIRLSKQAVSNYRTGYRKMSALKASEMQDVLHDAKFGTHAATEYFGTLLERTTKDLSYPENTFLIRDLRDDEEMDRQKLDDETYRIFRIRYEERTRQQHEVTHKYLRKFACEISTETLSFFAACQEARINPYDLIQDVNKENIRE